jgi:hypothetical protein
MWTVKDNSLKITILGQPKRIFEEGSYSFTFDGKKDYSELLLKQEEKNYVYTLRK